MTGGVCSVTGCSQHGLFFKRLGGIERISSKDRHARRPCLVPGCRYFNITMSRLSDHLRRRHAITIIEHETLYNTLGLRR